MMQRRELRWVLSLGDHPLPFPILAWFLGRGITQKIIFSFNNKKCTCCLCGGRKVVLDGSLNPRKCLVRSSIPRNTAGGIQPPACPPSLSLGLYLLCRLHSAPMCARLGRKTIWCEDLEFA